MTTLNPTQIERIRRSLSKRVEEEIVEMFVSLHPTQFQALIRIRSRMFRRWYKREMRRLKRGRKK